MGEDKEKDSIGWASGEQRLYYNYLKRRHTYGERGRHLDMMSTVKFTQMLDKLKRQEVMTRADEVKACQLEEALYLDSS